MFDSHSLRKTFKGFKLIYGSNTKRINEKIENFETFLKNIKSVHGIDLSSNIILFSENEDGIKNEIRNEKDFLKLLYENEIGQSTTCIKIYIELSNDKFDNVNQVITKEEIITKDFIRNLLEEILLKNKSNYFDDKLSPEYFLNVQKVPTPIIKKYSKNNSEEDFFKSKNISNFALEKNEKELIDQIDNMMSEKLNLLEEKINTKIQDLMMHSYIKNESDDAAHKDQIHSSNQFNPSNSSNKFTSSNASNFVYKENTENIQIFGDNQNNLKIQGSQIEFVNIENKNEPPIGSIFQDICSICSRNIYFVKYTCCICPNMNTCEKCENLHSHPMIKFKSNDLPSKEEVFFYMVSKYEKPSSSKNILMKKVKEISGNLFERKIKLKMYVYSDFISVRPSKKFKLPLIICNETKDRLPSCRVHILTQNNKDLIILSKTLDLDQYSKDRNEVYLECESNEQLKTYDFEILLYSNSAKIECDSLLMKIEINNDMEEEEINNYFAMHNKILAITKKEKALIMNILKNGVCDKHPYIIYNIMSKYDWDLQEALDELTLDDSRNRSLTI